MKILFPVSVKYILSIFSRAFKLQKMPFLEVIFAKEYLGDDPQTLTWSMGSPRTLHTRQVVTRRIALRHPAPHKYFSVNRKSLKKYKFLAPCNWTWSRGVPLSLSTYFSGLILRLNLYIYIYIYANGPFKKTFFLWNLLGGRIIYNNDI